MSEDKLTSCSKNTIVALFLIIMAIIELIFLILGFYGIYKNIELLTNVQTAKLWGFILYNCLSGLIIVIHNLYTSLNLTCSTKENDNNFLRYFLSIFRLVTFIIGTVILMSKNFTDNYNYKLIWNSFQQYYCYSTIIIAMNFVSLFVSLYLNCIKTERKLVIDENGLIKSVSYNRINNK
jgi:hypothetical protein